MTNEICNFSEAPDPAKYARSHNRIKAVVEKLWGLNIVGAENIPSKGACILAPKHNSLLDPFFVGAIVNRASFSMARKELWDQRRWHWITGYMEDRGAYPVDRYGQPRESLVKSLSLIRENKMLAINIEGTSKNRGRRVGQIQEGAGWLAMKASREGIECPIIAMGMTSEHSWKFNTVCAVAAKPYFVDVGDRSSAVVRREVADDLHTILQDIHNQALELQKSYD